MTDDEIGRLLSLISHEIRAPLGVMRGYLRLLEQQGTELSESHQHAVTAALKAGARATELLTQVSTLARLQRGEVVVNRRAIALEPLLRSAVHAVTMPPEPIVTIHVGETPAVAITGDEEQLRTAIAGLTSAVVRAQAVDARVLLLPTLESREGVDGVRVLITTIEAPDAAHADQPLDIMRGGLGVELPIAAFLVAAHGGHLHERRYHSRALGIALWLPSAPVNL